MGGRGERGGRKGGKGGAITHKHTQENVKSYPRMLGTIVSLDINMFSASYLCVRVCVSVCMFVRLCVSEENG